MFLNFYRFDILFSVLWCKVTAFSEPVQRIFPKPAGENPYFFKN